MAEERRQAAEERRREVAYADEAAPQAAPAAPAQPAKARRMYNLEQMIQK